MKIHVNVLYLNGNLNKSLFPLCAVVMPVTSLSVLLFCTYICVHAVSLKPESLWANEVQHNYILFSNAYYTRCWCNLTAFLLFQCFEYFINLYKFTVSSLNLTQILEIRCSSETVRKH